MKDIRSVGRQLAASVPGLFRVVGLFVLGSIVGACHAPGWDGYFSSGLDQLTQDKVLDRFGPPHTAKNSVLGGDSLWTYRISLGENDLDRWSLTFLTELSQSMGALIGKPNEQPKPTLYCYQYTLTFNEAHILKDWKRDECVPGTRDSLKANTLRPAQE